MGPMRLLIIIIMSRCQHVYFWPYLATPPYRPLRLAGLPGYIQYRHWAAICMFEQDALPLHVPAKGVHWSTSLKSSSQLLLQYPACLVCLTLIVFVTVGWWPYSCCLWGAVSRNFSVLLTAFSRNCRQASSPYVLLASTWCIHIAVSILPLLEGNCVLFYRSGLTSIRPIAYR